MLIIKKITFNTCQCADNKTGSWNFQVLEK